MQAPKNSAAALKKMESAASGGDRAAQEMLGDLYQQNQYYDRAEHWYRKAAEQGSAIAQFNLGLFYDPRHGYILNTDKKQAEQWYCKAAEQGYIPAQRALGEFHSAGNDDVQAAQWFRKAAEQGDPWAQNKLGEYYADGHGVPQDYAQAAQWFRKAAEQGNATAQNSLGMLYNDGQGVPQDYAQAVRWYRKAARQGDFNAQFNMGRSHATGDGVHRDDARAAQWFRKAIENDDADIRDALHELGALYEAGHGVPQSKVAAYALYSVSCRLDRAHHEEDKGMGAQNRSKLRDRMTRQEIEDGEELAIQIIYSNFKLKPLDHYFQNLQPDK
jgi:TPR repeat protein